jgi:carboxyl-terminal processing protease
MDDQFRPIYERLYEGYRRTSTILPRYGGETLRDQAIERIGHLYPKATLPEEHGGGEATVIAWIWARTVNVQLPMPKSQKHPVTAPQAVTTERLTDEIGLLRVAMFPGAIGIDVAKDIDRGVAALDGCNRLIVDLRGNTGGGIGGLRLMSYLTPGKLEVGYSLTRKRRDRGYRREELTRFGRIPSHKTTLLWLAARYAFVEKSILVVTEGLGERRFHGRIVLLVNEHTASAGEMVSAFAEENNLATIVGTKTPGRLLSGSAYKVGHGYILGLPVAAYLTWQGRMIENNGIVPKFSSDLSRDALKEGRDTQFETAVESAKAL